MSGVGIARVIGLTGSGGKLINRQIKQILRQEEFSRGLLRQMLDEAFFTNLAQ
jgi:hypothetical protein